MSITLSWFKKDTNFYSNRKIKILRKMPDGYKLVFLWDVVCAEAMKSDSIGYIRPLGKLNEYLSAVADLDIIIINMGLDAFIMLEMINISDTDILYVKNFGKKQSLDQIEYKKALGALRTQKHRLKIAEKYDEVKRIEFEINQLKSEYYSNDDCNVTETQCNTTEKSILEKNRKENISDKKNILHYFNKWLIKNESINLYELEVGEKRNSLYMRFLSSEYYETNVPEDLKK